MMDTYDPRPHHAHQPQLHASHPHYQSYAAYQYQQHHSVSLPTDSTAAMSTTHAYSNNGTAVRSGSAPSSHSGSGHSTPEGTYLDDFAYSTSQSSIPNVNSDSLIASTSSTSTGLPTPPATTTGVSNMVASSSTQRSGMASSSVPGSSNNSAGTQSSSSLSITQGTALSRPLTHKEQELLAHLDRLKFFLATAPSRWTDSEVRSDSEAAMMGGGRYQTGTPMMPHPNTHPALNRFLLPSGEYVTCVLWSGLYHITGTDIVRALVFRFEAFGRPVRNMKKFEEGVFSDLRNLKPGTDACLEEPKSQFLDLLFKYQCIRTQKKQKVFYWFSVPHDRLFLDALERDLKREKMGLEPTTAVLGEPARSFTYDPKRTLYEQFSKAQGAIEGESELETTVRRHEEQQREAQMQQHGQEDSKMGSDVSSIVSSRRSTADYTNSRPGSAGGVEGTANTHTGAPFFNMFRLFEGSPNYKQRRKKGPKTGGPSALGVGGRSALTRDSSEDDGMGGDDVEGELSAAALFDVGLSGGGGSKQDQAVRQAEKQRQVQAQHLALLNQQQRSSVGQIQVPSNALPPGGMYTASERFPSRSMHPSIVPTQTGMPRHPDTRHTYPMMAESHGHGHAHAGSLSSNMVAGANALPMMSAAQRASIGGGSGNGKTKVFVCPLMTCGKFFKRMEHLKRHIRTHTMEKPYECEVCHRRFSRADNLSQHLRTHSKDGNNASQQPYAGGDAGTDADVEDDELEGFAASQYADNMGLNMSGIDFNTCEIEVNEGAQDIQFGDEEEMMNVQVAGGNGYYSVDTPQFAHVVMSPENSPHLVSGQLQNESAGVQWATQHPASTHASVGFDAYASPQPSPAFSSASAPSPQASSMSHNVAAMMLNAPTSGNYRMHGGDYAGSMSAPSHKQVFDHTALYSQSLGLGNASASSGPGPVRRYRSVTPTIARSSENIRRPSTGTTDSLSGAISRAYHPYSVPSGQYASASTGSNHSSPVPYHTTADYQASLDQQRALSRQGSHSRSNSNSNRTQDDVQNLLAVDAVDTTLYPDVTSAAAVAQGAVYGDMYAHAQGRDVNGQYPVSGEGVGSATYYSAAVAGARNGSPHQQGLFSVRDVGINDAGQYQSAAVVASSYYDAVSTTDRSGAAI